MKTKNIRIILWIIIVAFAISSFGLSGQSGVTSTSLSDKVMVWLGLVSWNDISMNSYSYTVLVHLVRQTAHFLLYAFGTIPIFLLVYTYRKNLFGVAFITIVVGVVYALLDEIHQLFVAGRTFQMFDLATDLAGIMCMSIFLAIVIFFANIIYDNYSITRTEE